LLQEEQQLQELPQEEPQQQEESQQQEQVKPILEAEAHKIFSLKEYPLLLNYLQEALRMLNQLEQVHLIEEELLLLESRIRLLEAELLLQTELRRLLTFWVIYNQAAQVTQEVVQEQPRLLRRQVEMLAEDTLPLQLPSQAVEELEVPLLAMHTE